MPPGRYSCLQAGTTAAGKFQVFSFSPARSNASSPGGPFTPELAALLEAQKARTDALCRETRRIVPQVFHRRGLPIKDFRGAWRSACKAAGLPGRIPHDFRRTAVRNLERARVPRSVAMMLTGHKTESVYRRYAIVSESDLRAAAEQLHQATTPRMGTIAGTTSLKDPKPAANDTL